MDTVIFPPYVFRGLNLGPRASKTVTSQPLCQRFLIYFFFEVRTFYFKEIKICIACAGEMAQCESTCRAHMRDRVQGPELLLSLTS